MTSSPCGPILFRLCCSIMLPNGISMCCGGQGAALRSVGTIERLAAPSFTARCSMSRLGSIDCLLGRREHSPRRYGVIRSVSHWSRRCPAPDCSRASRRRTPCPHLLARQRTQTPSPRPLSRQERCDPPAPGAGPRRARAPTGAARVPIIFPRSRQVAEGLVPPTRSES
jgi:hypothetical protein